MDRRRSATTQMAMLVGAISAFAPIANAQTAGTDHRDGSYVNIEEAPIHPVELAAADSSRGEIGGRFRTPADSKRV